MTLRRIPLPRTLDARERTEGVPDGLPFNPDDALLARVDLLNLTTRFADFIKTNGGFRQHGCVVRR